jgi:putative ABC transport system permease protein
VLNGPAAHGVRSVLRDLRAGELRVLLAAVTISVAAMTAVAFFTDRVSQVVAMRSAEVLAADLVVHSNRPIEEQHGRRARELGLERATATSFASVVVAGDATALADIEAVSAGYPLRGQLRTADTPFAEPRVETSVPAGGEAWGDPKLLARLGVSVGAEVSVGERRLMITRVLDYRPDQGWSFVDLAPTLLINEADVDATGLVQPGSRVSYRQMFAGDRGAIDRLREEIEARLGVSERIRDLRDAGPEIRSALDRAQRFLGLAALVGTLLAAIAVAMAAARYARRQIDPVALMKAFGAPQAYVLRMIVAQLAALAVLAGVAGVAIGFTAQQGLAWLLADIAGGALPAPGARPVLGGLLLSVLVLGGFAYPSLVATRRVPPLRVLRRDLAAPPPSVFGLYGLAVAAVLGLLLWQAGDPMLAGWLGAAVVAFVLVLAAGAAILVWLATRVRGSAGAAWRYALAGVGRRRRDSILQVVAFGLGIMILLLLTVVRSELLVDWQATLPEDAPNRFLINIQPDEVGEVGEFLESTVGGAELVPLVRARLVAVNETPAAELAVGSERGQRMVDREANLSSSAALQEDNRVVEGEWWGDGGAPGQVSVELEFARDVGIALGDRLSFDVAGEIFVANVTSLRTVQWDSFQPNFFMLFSPGSLDAFPRTHIGSIHVGEGQRGVLLDMVRLFPSITVIDIDAVLGQVRRVMDQASLAVQYVFLFSLAAGVVVLLAVVESGRESRMFESALLRALGARRGQVFASAVIEFSLLGVLAGLLASAGALATGALLADKVFRLEFSAGPWIWVIGVAAGLLLVGVTGILATRTVVTHAPMAVLRRF